MIMDTNTLKLHTSLFKIIRQLHTVFVSVKCKNIATQRDIFSMVEILTR